MRSSLREYPAEGSVFRPPFALFLRIWRDFGAIPLRESTKSEWLIFGSWARYLYPVFVNSGKQLVYNKLKNGAVGRARQHSASGSVTVGRDRNRCRPTVTEPDSYR